MQNSYVALLRTAWTYARHEKRQYVLVYLMFVMANVASSLNPLLFGWFVGKLQQDRTDVLQTLWLYGLGYAGLVLLEWVFHGPARVMERRLAFNLSRNFLDELFHQTLHLSVGWHKENHSGSTINRIRKAYEALKSFFQDGFNYLHTLLKLVFSFVAILYLSPFFGLIGLGLGAITIFVIRRFDRPYMQALDETNEQEHVVSSNLFDSLSNIITVITLRLEERMQQSLSAKIVAVLPPFMRQVRINEWKWFFAHLLVTLIYLVLAGGYVYEHYVPGQVFLVGGLVALLGYVNQFTSVFHDIAYQYTDIVQHNINVQTTRSIGKAYSRYSRPDRETLPQHWQTIQINGLSFSHSGSTHRASLSNLSITIRRGKRIAVIGASGSGKSTLLTLLRGLYQPEPGMLVRVDGKPETNLNAIANSVTLLPQEPEIFENTITYNITLGLPFDAETIDAVCRAARFDSVVDQLPQGLDTNIQEKGVNLSGGQRQRLALARGILAARSSDIVLLDEPTSSVDPKTELAVYRELFREFADKAVVSTLHRLHLLPLFDYVYIMDEGKIVDEGPFSHLRQHSPIFRDLWAHQQEHLRSTDQVV